MNILVTGCAGFIGYNLTIKLLKNKKNTIIGIDKKNWTENQTLKKKYKNLRNLKNFFYHKVNISNYLALKKIFENKKIDIIIHLAAEAGIRKSITNSNDFFSTNLVGFYNMMEIAKNNNIKNFFYASSSSVYGDAPNYPTNEEVKTDYPLSFYAATKKCNEIIAHSYSHLYNISTTGFRFFTVYGPYGRTDMAIYKFFKNIISNKEINLYNSGNHIRDYTFVENVVDDIKKIIFQKNNNTKYQIYNIGGGSKTNLKSLISKIEIITKTKARINNLKLQSGDVLKTQSDNTRISKLTNRRKYITIDQGLNKYYKWFLDFYF